MANVLKIKKNSTWDSTSNPSNSDVVYGELAWANGTKRLYIGRQSTSGGAVTATRIGGEVGLANDNIVKLDEACSSGEVAVYGSTGLTGRTTAEFKSDLSINNVENTALSTWAGSTNITTLGTIGTGTWNGDQLAANKVPNVENLNVGGNVAMGGNRITGLAAPVSANDAARKTDVDAAVQGLDVRDSVRLHLDSPSQVLSGTPTIDGVSSVAGDRVLVSAQGASNGIYVVASNAWSRATDLNANSSCSANMFFFVEEGTTYADTAFVCTTNEDVTLANMAFAQFSGLGQITAGDGLNKSGATLNADLKSNGGIVIESAKLAVDLAASSITGTLAIADGGTGATTVSGARSALGLTIGGDVQAYDADLNAIATLSKTDGNFIVGNGSTWVAESGSTARTSLGLGNVENTALSTATIDGGTF